MASQRGHELETVQRVSQVLFQTIDLDELVETTLRTSLDEVGAESGSILLADVESRQLVFQYSLGVSPVPRGTAIPWDQGISGAVFQSGKPTITRDVTGSDHHFAGIDESTGHQTRDMITLPLKRWRGDPIGVLNVLNKRQDVFDEEDLALLTVISAFAALAIQQARLFDEAKMAEVVRFLGDIGHDLKNLLQPVVSGAWLIEGELDDMFGNPEETLSGKAKLSHQICADSVAMIRRTCDRIHDRVKEVADCVQGLSAPPHFTPCAVAGVVDDVLRTLGVLAQEKSIALHAARLGALPLIMADERRLYSAFYNLVNNAISAVPEGGSITVTGRADPDTSAVFVSVIDTGRGMPPDIRDRLFSARAISTKTEGTGLGTKIVKDVIDAHNGQITVESAVGAGTSFHLRLPLDPTQVGRSKSS
jgi:signal transduction histidine kinase